jgi:hypothetical protein
MCGKQPHIGFRRYRLDRRPRQVWVDGEVQNHAVHCQFKPTVACARSACFHPDHGDRPRKMHLAALKEVFLWIGLHYPRRRPAMPSLPAGLKRQVRSFHDGCGVPINRRSYHQAAYAVNVDKPPSGIKLTGLAPEGSEDGVVESFLTLLRSLLPIITWVNIRKSCRYRWCRAAPR